MSALTSAGVGAQVDEQRVSGGVDLIYFHEPIGSIYQGLGNVMLRLEPTDQPAANNSTLLLNAHYDSTLGSQGGFPCFLSLTLFTCYTFLDWFQSQNSSLHCVPLAFVTVSFLLGGQSVGALAANTSLNTASST